jgi:hypothetical protein
MFKTERPRPLLAMNRDLRPAQREIEEEEKSV